jgi:Family of unknown function (DUF6228)
MEQFVLKSEQGAKVVFHSRKYDESGWLDSYSIDLEAHGFRASTIVENPGYGHLPSQLFDKLATQWSGWSGAERWCAMEGELEIEATSDALGHIKLQFKVPGYSQSKGWSSSAWLLVEAGQLERLAREANAFFNQDA